MILFHGSDESMRISYLFAPVTKVLLLCSLILTLIILTAK